MPGTGSGAPLVLGPGSTEGGGPGVQPPSSSEGGSTMHDPSAFCRQCASALSAPCCFRSSSPGHLQNSRSHASLPTGPFHLERPQFSLHHISLTRSGCRLVQSLPGRSASAAAVASAAVAASALAIASASAITAAASSSGDLTSSAITAA